MWAEGYGMIKNEWSLCKTEAIYLRFFQL